MRTTNPRRCVLGTEVLESRETPAALLTGGIVRGSVAADNGFESWTFDGTAGSRIELITTSTPQQAGFVALAEVFAPSGTRVATFWPGDNQNFALSETGPYTVQVRDDNRREAGTYTIGFEGLNPASPNPGPMVEGDIVRGTVGVRTEKDQWAFEGVSGQRVELITTSTPQQAGFVALAEVFAPSGTRVAIAWPGDNQNFVLTETGTYTVQVRDDNYAEAGDYTIGFEGLNPISPGPAPLPAGAIAPGTVAAPTEKDQLTFEGVSGQRVELITTSTPQQAGFVALAEVFAPSGTRVAIAWPGDNVTIDLHESGTYMVQVRDDNYRETGDYTVALESLNPTSPDAKGLARGKQVGGKIDAATEKDQWTFRVADGKRLKLVLGQKAITPGFRALANVYDAAGNRVATMWVGKQVFNLEPGVYTIQVNDAGYFKKGKYTLKANWT